MYGQKFLYSKSVKHPSRIVVVRAAVSQLNQPPAPCCFHDILFDPIPDIIFDQRFRVSQPQFWNCKRVLVGPLTELDFQFWPETSLCVPHFSLHLSIPVDFPVVG